MTLLFARDVEIGRLNLNVLRVFGHRFCSSFHHTQRRRMNCLQFIPLFIMCDRVTDVVFAHAQRKDFVLLELRADFVATKDYHTADDEKKKEFH